MGYHYYEDVKRDLDLGNVVEHNRCWYATVPHLMDGRLCRSLAEAKRWVEEHSD